MTEDDVRRIVREEIAKRDSKINVSVSGYANPSHIAGMVRAGGRKRLGP